jgi:hypothetical protein
LKTLNCGAPGCAYNYLPELQGGEQQQNASGAVYMRSTSPAAFSMQRPLFRLVSAFMLFTPLGLSSVAHADWFEPLGEGWTAYVNERFGTRLQYPSSLFNEDTRDDDGGGYQFVAEDATLDVRASENSLEKSVGELRRGLLALERYDEVTYKPTGSSWFVLSGYRGDQIYYEKYIFRAGVVHAFAVEFPISAKPIYAPIIDRIEDSFGIEPGVNPPLASLAAPPAAAPPPVAPNEAPPSSLRERLPGAPAENPQNEDPLVVY